MIHIHVSYPFIFFRLSLTTYAALVVMCIWELRQRDAILPQLIRCLSVLMLGTWLCHMAFILYDRTPFPGKCAIKLSISAKLKKAGNKMHFIEMILSKIW